MKLTILAALGVLVVTGCGTPSIQSERAARSVNCVQTRIKANCDKHHGVQVVHRDGRAKRGTP